MKSIARVFALLLLLMLAACDDSDNDDVGVGIGAFIERITADPSIVPVGQASIVSVEFSFSANDVLDDNDRVDVVLHIPPGFAYRVGTAEIQRPIDDNQVDPESSTPCPNGSSFLRFEFGRGELTDATNPSGDADAELRLTIDAAAANPSAVLSAAAASNTLVPFSCASSLPAQASASISSQ